MRCEYSIYGDEWKWMNKNAFFRVIEMLSLHMPIIWYADDVSFARNKVKNEKNQRVKWNKQRNKMHTHASWSLPLFTCISRDIIIVYTWKWASPFFAQFLLPVVGEFRFFFFRILMNDERHDEMWRIITQYQKAYAWKYFFSSSLGHKQASPPTIYFSFRFLKQFVRFLWVKIRAYSVEIAEL